MFKKVAFLLSGHALGALLLFVRNILVARLIGIEDYGIAAMFAMAMAAIEMGTDIGLQQFIVQADDGDDPEFQANLQGFHLLRALCAALVVVVCAHPFADFMGVPEVAWAFQILAVTRVALGFVHFDIYRLQRKLTYTPLLLSLNGSCLVGLVVVYPLALNFGDYRVMLYALIAQAVAQAVISHLLAQRPYRLRLEGAMIRRMLVFGWPLLANGVLMFLVLNGEKMAVGREVSPAALGLFAMGMTLTVAPAMILSRTIGNFFLPQVSAAKNDPEAFRRIAYVGAQTALLSGLILVAGVATLGPWFVTLILGPDFAPLTELLVWLVILQAIRGSKGGLVATSMAKGKTSNMLYANLCRVLSLPLSWYALTQGAELWMVALIATAGEFCGFLVSQALIRKQLRVSIRPLMPCYGAVGLFYLCLMGHMVSVQLLTAPLVPASVTLGLTVAAFGLALSSLRALWSYLRKREYSAY